MKRKYDAISGQQPIKRLKLNTTSINNYIHAMPEPHDETPDEEQTQTISNTEQRYNTHDDVSSQSTEESEHDMDNELTPTIHDNDHNHNHNRSRTSSQLSAIPETPEYDEDDDIINEITATSETDDDDTDTEEKAHQSIYPPTTPDDDHSDEPIIPNLYHCHQCDIHVAIRNDDRFSNGYIRPFLHRFKCEKCIDADAANKSLPRKSRTYVQLMCIEEDCKSFGKIWAGRNSYTSWLKHYRQHPTNSYLRATNQKLCNDGRCNHVINADEHLCIQHSIYNEQDDEQRARTDQHGTFLYTDKNGDTFDLARCRFNAETQSIHNNEEHKHALAQMLTKCIFRLANVYKNRNNAIKAAIEMMLYQSTYHHVPYNANKDSVKTERMRRDQMFKAGKYKTLIDRIKFEQNRIEQKRIRKQHEQIRHENAMPNTLPTGQKQDEVENKENIQPNHLQHESNMIFNHNLLTKHMQDLRYNQHETGQDIKERIKRCIRFAKRGQYKKAHQALEPQCIADLTKNDNWLKTQKKYPPNPNLRLVKNAQITPTYRLNTQRIQQIIRNLNKQSVGGPINIANEILIWIADREETYHFCAALNKLAEVAITRGMPSEIQTILLYARGMPIGKEKHGQPDYDIRPIGITDATLRVMDTLAISNLDKADKRRAMGSSQLIEKRRATEIANAAIHHQCGILADVDGEAMINFDISNAFNSGDRAYGLQVIEEELPDLANWYHFLYDRPTPIDFGNGFALNMEQGWIQGLHSSNIIFSTVLHRVQSKAEERTKNEHPEFKINFAINYVDDGMTSIYYEYLPSYIAAIKTEYLKGGFRITVDKTNIIMRTNKQHIMDFVKQQCEAFNYNFYGCFKFLGVHYGTDQYIQQQMVAYCQHLAIKLRHIEAITDTQIRLILFRKFFNYNKVIYIMKNMTKPDLWIRGVQNIYEYIQQSITLHLNHREIMYYQLPISQHRGGLALRPPSIFYPASRISAMNCNQLAVREYFGFHVEDAADDTYDISIDDIDYESIQHSIAYKRATRRHNEEKQRLLDQLNQFLAPDLTAIITPATRHKDLIELIDRRYLNQYYEQATDKDKARIKSLSTNGSLSYLNVPPNPEWGVKFTNQQMYIILSNILGLPLIPTNTVCKKCKQIIDQYGHHSLHCPVQGQVIRRHNQIRDELAYFIRQAGYQYDVEQKYTTAAVDMMGEVDEQIDPALVRDDDTDIQGIPGDIKIINYFGANREYNDAYLDVVVSNIYAKSYIGHTKQERLWLAKKKERDKRAKYGDIPELIPLSIEATGAMAPDFRRFIQQLADRIAARKNIRYSVIVSRIRSRIIAKLMAANVEMVLSSIEL